MKVMDPLFRKITTHIQFMRIHGHAKLIYDPSLVVESKEMTSAMARITKKQRQRINREWGKMEETAK